MSEPSDLANTLDLADYRRRVADIYAEVRRRGLTADSWQRWGEARSELLRTHPQSPLDDRHRASATSVGYFDYDPSWRVVGTVHAAEPIGSATPPTRTTPPTLHEGRSSFAPIGSVSFERSGMTFRLGLFWLQGYGGALFLPFGDKTNGRTTYGGGRYLLDGAKSADLGSPAPGRLLLDFNFSYHPSCAWDPVWPCPLAPPGNRMSIEVEAGERRPEPNPE